MRHPCLFVLMALAFLAPHAFEATAAWADEAAPTPASVQSAADSDSPESSFQLVPDPPCMLPFAILFNVLVLGAMLAALVLAVVVAVFALALICVLLVAAALLALALLVLVAVLVVVVLGAAVAAVAAAILLPCVWIAGISVAVGFLCHGVRSAFRAAFIQLGALAGIACGIGLLWSANELLHLGLKSPWVAGLGAAAGLAGGVAAALLFNWAWGRGLDWIVKRCRTKRPQPTAAP